jgi:hypothetical protein
VRAAGHEAAAELDPGGGSAVNGFDAHGWVVNPPEPPAPLTLDGLIEWADRARSVPAPPRRIRVAPGLYEMLRTEAHDRFAYPSAAVASSVFGIEIVVDYRLAPGEHQVDES